MESILLNKFGNARKKLGLTCSKNNFWIAIRNPVYCGKIVIPKYKDEESYRTRIA